MACHCGVSPMSAPAVSHPWWVIEYTVAVCVKCIKLNGKALFSSRSLCCRWRLTLSTTWWKPSTMMQTGDSATSLSATMTCRYWMWAPFNFICCSSVQWTLFVVMYCCSVHELYLVLCTAVLHVNFICCCILLLCTQTLFVAMYCRSLQWTRIIHWYKTIYEADTCILTILEQL